MSAPLSLRAPFDAIEPKDVLYFFDEPLLFTAEESGGTFLCLRTSDDDAPEFLVVPTDEGITRRLRDGSLSLRSAFLRPWAWRIRTDSAYRVGDTEYLNPHAIPDHLLPEEGVGLYAHHGTVADEFKSAAPDGFLSVSFKGGELTNGTMPLGTLKALVDEVYSSLRQIFAPVVQKMFREPIGEATISRVLQLPVHQPKFASLSLSFDAPSLDMSGIKKAVDLDVAAWTKEANEATQDFMASAEHIHELAADSSIVEKFAYGAPLALEVLSKIAPSATTSFETLEIRGKAGSEDERRIVIDVARGARIVAAYAGSRRGSQDLKGKIVDTNLRSGTIIVQKDGGRETTCLLGKRLIGSEPTEIRNNGYVTVFGSLTSRSRRDWMVVRKIVLPSGRVLVRHEGDGAFVAE